jgi:saccharopine dehydrogenase-like NADP-dependent oxidoreductase
VRRLAWLGLFGERPLDADLASPLDVLASLMFEKLVLPDDETDMVVMQHEFLARYPGGEEQTIHSTLVDYGEKEGDTSVARTVSLPAAMAVKGILEGAISPRGVYIPVVGEIYDPILAELENEGIRLRERFSPSVKPPAPPRE